MPQLFVFCQLLKTARNQIGKRYKDVQEDHETNGKVGDASCRNRSVENALNRTHQLVRASTGTSCPSPLAAVAGAKPAGPLADRRTATNLQVGGRTSRLDAAPLTQL